MKNERMVTRKLFISCILILCIIFATIIILQKDYYENKFNKDNSNIESPFTIIEDNDMNLEKMKEI